MSFINEKKKEVMKISREKKLEHFYSLYKEGQSVLDVGVSAESKKAVNSLENYFLKNFRYDPGTYTGLGVQDVTQMKIFYPGKIFFQYPGSEFPFADKEFDWVFSNAVIEHVGDDDAQLLFLNEMVRVAKNVFFTTPNKFFPVEAHSNVLFLHWNNTLFYKWCEKNRPAATKNTLYLLSLHRLQKILKSSSARSYKIYKNRLFGIPMTFTICIHADR